MRGRPSAAADDEVGELAHGPSHAVSSARARRHGHPGRVADQLLYRQAGPRTFFKLAKSRRGCVKDIVLVKQVSIIKYVSAGRS